MSLDPKEVIEKITRTDLEAGGLMTPEQAEKFIDLTVDQSKLLKMVRVHRTNRDSGEISKLQIGEPVTEDAALTPVAETVPGNIFDKVTFSVKKLRSALDLPKDVLEDNIEGENFQDTIMAAVAKRVGTDHELLAIMGDTEAYAADNTKTGRLLRTLDGWHKQTSTGVHIVDAAGQPVSRSLFSKAIRELPAQYKVDRSQLRFFVSPSVWQDYADALADRPTAGGDEALKGISEIRVFGVPLVEVPMIPENLGTSGNQTFVWLTIPANFIYVVRREFEVHWEFVPRRDVYENTTYSRIAVCIENKDAIVKIINVALAA